MKKLYVFLLALFIISNVSGQSCLPEGIIFTSQAEIDNFKVNYPDCTEIEGYVEIEGSGITNLDSLHQVTAVGGYLDIYSVPDLTDIEGLGALTSVGTGRLGISGTALTDLQGLGNLSSVPGLRIEGNLSLTSLQGLNSLTTVAEGVYIIENPLLENFDGLQSLTSVGVGGTLIINYNDMLASLSGLENIHFDPLYQIEIWIDHNPLLSECEVNSICALLNENRIIHVSANASGCNTIDEVRSACSTSIEETGSSDLLVIHPNPAHSTITIDRTSGHFENSQLTITGINGREVLDRRITETRTEIDINNLPAGIYFLNIRNDKEIAVRKIIKE